MLSALKARLDEGRPVLAVGLMSGTSADGVDAALVRLWREEERLRVELVRFETTPYPAPVRDLLFRCFDNVATVRDLCALNAVVGELFADAAEAVAAAGSGPGAEEPLAFVASHGQTVWHEPVPDGSTLALGAERARGTLQIGEAARIAVRLGVPVVSDFRQQDIALGGQGAPLAPYMDYLLFSHPTEARAVQNLGGIGNVTYLPAGGAMDQVKAFDTGPANAWIDAAAGLVSGGELTCDLDGRLAALARVDRDLLDRLLREPYFRQPPPKSTGRELFSAARVRELWDAGHRGSELVSTLTQLTVESVAGAYRQWLGPVDRVIIGGGGARNPELMDRLGTALSPAAVCTHEALGIDSEAKEAIAFAILGCETLRNLPSNVPSATGAARPCIQGKICLP